MSNENFFKHDDKAYAENLNDAVLIGNAFNFEVPVNLPSMYLNNHFPTDTNVHKAGVADVTIISSGSLSIGDEAITNNTNSSQMLRLRIYPNFNNFYAWKRLNWTCTGAVTVNICDAGTSTSLLPSGALTNPDNETLLNGISSLQGLKEYDLLITIPVNGVLNTLSLVFVNKWNSQNRVSASISQDNVTGLSDSLASKVSVSDIKDNLTSTATNVPLSAKQGKVLNDTKLNTSNLFNLVYPVGSIYMSVNSTSPATLFGGTWEKIEDKFLLASGSTYANNSTGGSADAVVVSHTHTQQSHSHTNTDGNFVTSDVASANNTRVDYSSNGTRMVDGIATTSSIFHHRPITTGTTAINNATGVDGTGKNMPPYLVVNVWKRTA